MRKVRFTIMYAFFYIYVANVYVSTLMNKIKFAMEIS